MSSTKSKRVKTEPLPTNSSSSSSTSEELALRKAELAKLSDPLTVKMEATPTLLETTPTVKSAAPPPEAPSKAGKKRRKSHTESDNDNDDDFKVLCTMQNVLHTVHDTCRVHVYALPVI